MGDTVTPAAAVVTSGKIKLDSNNAAGIVVSGGAVASAGLVAGTTNPSTTLTVNSISTINLSTVAGAQNALNAIDGALATVNSSRASLGAYQNRFASVVSSLQTTSENLSASRSRIQDTDFAHETASLTRGQILQQAGTAMLAQANSLPNGVLALLRG
jgi:flagellin